VTRFRGTTELDVYAANWIEYLVLGEVIIPLRKVVFCFCSSTASMMLSVRSVVRKGGVEIRHGRFTFYPVLDTLHTWNTHDEGLSLLP